MTLNSVVGLILRFFSTKFDNFAGRLCRSTYNVRKILSPIYSLTLLVKTHAPLSEVSLRHEHLVFLLSG